ncbi:EpsG family protein [Lachnospiraceae bacterium 48-42]
MYTGTFLISIAFIALSIKYEKKKITHYVCLFIGLLIPSLLAGLRDFSIGNDVLLYGNYWFYRAVSYTSLWDYLKETMIYSMDLGYSFINYLSSMISEDAHFFYFIYAILQMAVLYYAVRDYKKQISVPFAFFVYFFTYYNSSLNILRQIMAILLVLLSYKYVFDKKLAKFLLSILLAASFHISAVVGIILYPLNWAIHTDFKKFWRASVVVGSMLLVVTYEYVLNFIFRFGLASFSKYTHYLEDDQGGGRFIRFAFWGIIACAYFWRRKKINKIAPNYELLGFCILFSLLTSIVNFFSGAWLIRAMYYFDCASVISIPLIAKALPLKVGRQKEKINYILVGVFIFVYWLIVYVIRNGAETFPYQFMKFQ